MAGKDNVGDLHIAIPHLAQVLILTFLLNRNHEVVMLSRSLTFMLNCRTGGPDDQPRMLLSFIPGYPMLNFMLATAIYVAVGKMKINYILTLDFVVTTFVSTAWFRLHTGSFN